MTITFVIKGNDMDRMMVRYDIRGFIGDARLTRVNDLSILLFFVALRKEEIVDEGCFVGNHDKQIGLKSEILRKSDPKKVEILLTANEIYGAEINKMQSDLLLHIWRRIDSLFVVADATVIFEELLSQIDSFSRYNESGTSSEELAKFITEICMAKVGLSIYNPFCGFGTLALQFPIGCSYYGEEINFRNSAIANLRLLVHDKAESSMVENLDSLKKSEVSFTHKFDIVTAIPPFNLRSNNGKLQNVNILELGLKSLTNSGKLVYVLSSSVLNDRACSEILKSLCGQDILEGIISLPVGMLPKIGIRCCVLIINKSKERKGFVRMVDASEFGRVPKGNADSAKFTDTLSAYYSSIDTDAGINVKNEDLLALENLIPEHLFHQSFSSNIDHAYKLGDIVLEDRPCIRQLNDLPSKLPRINFADLNNNIKLDYRGLKPQEVKKNDYILNRSCFLLGTFNGSLKFSYFEYKGELYSCSPNVIPVILNDQIASLVYFAKQLTEPYVQQQIRYLTKGSAIQKVSKSDLFKVAISILPLDEQDRQKEVLLKFFHEADRNLQVLASLEDQLFEQTAYLRHSIAGPTGNILSFFKRMMRIIDQNPDMQAKEFEAAKLKQSDRYNFRDMRKIVERDLIKIENIVKNQLDVQEQILSSELRVMDIDGFLMNYVGKLSVVHPNVEIKYESFVPFLLEDYNKADFVTILGNPDLLRTMLDNLFENARQHAFSEAIERKFLVKLFYDEDSGELSVEVANSGKRFPEEVDFKSFITKNKRSANSSGDGFGGWYIYQVIQHHKGGLDIEDNSIYKEEISDGYTTSFHITLPLVNEEVDHEL